MRSRIARLCVPLLLALTACGSPPDGAAPGLGHVERRGTGPTHVVLIPCHSCDWRAWEPFMERNKARYTMHAVTLSGMGGTPPLPLDPVGSSKTPWLDASARALADYMRREAPGGILVGHSLGAIVALKATLHSPGVVSKLALVDWGAVHPESASMDRPLRSGFGRARADSILAVTPEAFQTQMEQGLTERLRNPARLPVYLDMVRKMTQSVAAQYSRELGVADLRPRLGEIRIPVLGMFALNPGEDPEPKMQEVQTVLAGELTFNLVWFEDTGHWIHEERPERFDEVLLSFVSDGASPR